MKLNPQKCIFRAGSGKFLGFLIIPRGIKMNPEKVQAIFDMPPPKSQKEIQRVIFTFQITHFNVQRSKAYNAIRISVRSKEVAKEELIPRNLF